MIRRSLAISLIFMLFASPLHAAKARFETDGESIRILTEKPMVTWEVKAPFAPFWTAENCVGWQALKTDASLWVHGECRLSWRVWIGPVPLILGTYLVAQEYTVHPSGFTDVYFPVVWRGKVGENPPPVD